jgi:hypothetical protein
MTCDYDLTSKKIPIVPDSIIRYRKIGASQLSLHQKVGIYPFI